MKYIVTIVVVAIIVVGVLIGLLIQRFKNRQTEELDFQRERSDLAVRQLGAAMRGLQTIRDLQGDSSLDAQLALDEINKLRDDHYTNQEKRITR